MLVDCILSCIIAIPPPRFIFLLIISTEEDPAPFISPSIVSSVADQINPPSASRPSFNNNLPVKDVFEVLCESTLTSAKPSLGFIISFPSASTPSFLPLLTLSIVKSLLPVPKASSNFTVVNGVIG